MQVVRLVDRVGVDSMIHAETFEDALIVGPAVIALLGGVTMDQCSFSGDPDSLFIEVAVDRRVVGVIGLVGTTFRRCQFQNIGIIGPAEAIEPFREELIRGTQDAMHRQTRLVGALIPQGLLVQSEGPPDQPMESAPPAPTESSGQ